jgi:hypothetical protein
MQRPVMNLKSTLERISMMGSAFLPPAYERDDPAAWDRNWRADRMALEDLLDVDLLRVGEAREAGWGDFAGHDDRTLAVRLPDRSVGMVDAFMRLPRPSWLRVHDHVADFLLGRVESRAHPTPVPLPDVARDVLAADGLDPAACERLGVTLGRLAVTIHGRHHGFARDLPKDYQIEYMGDLAAGRYRRLDPSRTTWREIKIVVSRDPQVHVLDGKVTARVQLPEAVKASLIGRPLTDVFEHPAFTGRTITAATSRPSGMTLKVR